MSLDKNNKPATKFSPKRLHGQELDIYNDILVKYAGLEIFVADFHFKVKFQQKRELISAKLNFKGSGRVVVSGSYRGLGSASFNETVQGLVKDEIIKNIKMLKLSNGGEGAAVDLRLRPNKPAPPANYFYANAKFDSPLNLSKALIPKTEYDLGTFSPKRAASKEFEKWGQVSIAALLKDAGPAAQRPQTLSVVYEG